MKSLTAAAKSAIITLFIAFPAFSESLPFKPVELENSWWYTPIGDKLYFAGYQRDDLGNVAQMGIWRSDGTEGGTQRISGDIFSYANSIRIHDEKLGNRVFFVADLGNDGDNELYYADETAKQNVLIGKFNDIPLTWTVQPLEVYQGKLVFSVNEPVYGDELWIGTGDAGIYNVLKDICPGACSSSPTEVVEFNNLLFFDADDGTTETELWVSDGTEAGTQLFLNIYADSGSPTPGDYVTAGSPTNFTIVGSKLFFVANDGAHGRELWASDGTAGGTAMVKDCTPGDKAGDPFDSNPTEFLAHNNKLYFKTLNDTGTETVWDIWETDGTEGGTKKLYTYSGGSSAFSAPAEFAAMGNQLFFSMFHPDYGYEVFWLDLNGLLVGPQLLKDIYPGIGEFDIPNGSDPWHLTAVEGVSPSTGRLYFRAEHPSLGTELWVSDGTTSGTVVLKDITPGPTSSSLDNFESIGHQLFFRENGLHLWVVDLTLQGGVPDGQDVSKPKLTLKSPGNGARVKSRFSVKGTAQDNQGVAAVQCTYAGIKGWTNASRIKTEALSKGGERVTWKCGVQLSKGAQRKLRNKGGRVNLKVKATDYSGNAKQIRRIVYLQ